ncbi:MAG: M2 family metallopeptidase, partial [Acidobacteriota bacterium]
MNHGETISRAFPLVLAAFILIAAPAALAAAAPASSALQERADRFLALVNASYQALSTVEQRALWDAATDVSPVHDAASEAAGKARAAFNGNPAIINEAKALLARASELDQLTVRQLQRALLNAAEGPMTNPPLVAARIEAETKQASTMNGFTFMLDGKPITPNEIDAKLEETTELAQRLSVWEASKQSGPALKPGLVKLQGLRNGVARELGYHDYFALQAANHDMTTAATLKMHEAFLSELKPLYLQLHTWAKYELAKKYAQSVPKKIPAHWISNRWAQEWNGMVPSASLDAAFAGHDAEWIVRTAEQFWTGIGMEALPASFWKDSDLYPIKPAEARKKNTHASCWHIDLWHDIRSLMSVEANEYWFSTAHHELGHGHYDLNYARPEVPPLLRTSASPAYHEAMAGIGELASRQTLYLQSLGLLPKGQTGNEMEPLLREALTIIPFMFWGSGVMTHFEADLYANELPSAEWNVRWWKYVSEFQGVEPPAPRGEEYCDAATKTHINDTPAYYFSYATANVLTYQLHDHIARKILKADPRNCKYAGNHEVGAFLTQMMRKGASQDWRTVLREATGEELSTRAMVEYFKPLMAWLEAQNKGRQIGW